MPFKESIRKLIGTLDDAFQVTMEDDTAVVLDVDTRLPSVAGAAINTMNVEVNGQGNFHIGSAYGSLTLRVFNRINTGTQTSYLRCAQWQVATKGDSVINVPSQGFGMRGLHGSCVHDSTGTVNYMQGARFSTSILAGGSTVASGTVTEAITILVDPSFGSASGTGSVTDWYYIKCNDLSGSSAGNRTVGNLYGLHLGDFEGISGVTNSWAIKTGSGKVEFGGRTMTPKGSDVASGSTITLGDANYFDITGTTAIDYITTTGWIAGSEVTLQFDSSVTVNHNSGSVPADTAAILLSGSANFSATADDTLTLIYDGVTWREKCRTVI